MSHSNAARHRSGIVKIAGDQGKDLLKVRHGYKGRSSPDKVIQPLGILIIGYLYTVCSYVYPNHPAGDYPVYIYS